MTGSSSTQPNTIQLEAEMMVNIQDTSEIACMFSARATWRACGTSDVALTMVAVQPNAVAGSGKSVASMTTKSAAKRTSITRGTRPWRRITAMMIDCATMNEAFENQIAVFPALSP